MNNIKDIDITKPAVPFSHFVERFIDDDLWHDIDIITNMDTIDDR
jgi:hypothetical protein